MKIILNFLKNILVLAAIAAGVFLVFNQIWFLDRRPFASPLDKNIKLVVRADLYGDGHFGARRSGARKHNGIDLMAPVGTDVRSVKSGWVVAAREARGFGKYVEIYHGQGLISIYAHLDEINVNVLQRVRQGQVIGAIGKTGNANHRAILPHLHLELIQDGQYLDPTPKLLHRS
jgi:murein DD-endopeptidase MepM/ murein hydrolase activator NlpD